jgi:hypothetical protein
VACGISTNNPEPDQHSPLDRLTPPSEKKDKKNKLNNKQAAEKKKDT